MLAPVSSTANAPTNSTRSCSRSAWFKIPPDLAPPTEQPAVRGSHTRFTLAHQWVLRETGAARGRNQKEAQQHDQPTTNGWIIKPRNSTPERFHERLQTKGFVNPTPTGDESEQAKMQGSVAQ